MLLNIGFGVTIVAALLLLADRASASPGTATTCRPPAASTAQTITKDAFNRQVAINAFRTDYQKRRIRTLLTAGHLRAADAQARQAILDQRNQQAPRSRSSS